MNKFNLFMESYFMPFAEKLSEQRHLKAIRDGIITTMPLFIIGSIFLILAFPPIPALAEWMKPYVKTLTIPVNATFGIMALIAAFAIAYNLAKHYKMDALSAGVLSVVAFLMVTPNTEDGNIPLGLMGSEGLFVAIILALISVEIFRILEKNNIVIRMPKGVPPSVGRAFSALIPGFIIVLLVWGIRVILEVTAGLSVHELIGVAIKEPLQGLGGSLWATLLVVFLIQLLWSAGIHGDSIIASVMAPIWYSLAEQNAAAMVAGEELPNVISQQFVAIWIAVGGSGMALALTLLFILRARSKHLKGLGKMTVWSSFFNISEPVVFGAPIVMNPLIIIPFIFTPLVVATITYISMSLGLVAKPYVIVPWTTPIPFSGFLTTGDWRAVILMLVNLLVAMGIYYPFFRVWDKKLASEEMETSVEAGADKNTAL